MTLHPIITRALEARTNNHVRELEDALRMALVNPRDHELDSNRGNWSSVASAADAEVILCERIVNMHDALIEAAVARRTDNEQPWRSPSEAASDIFADGAAIDTLLPARRAELARDAVMTLFDSDHSGRTPTIAFRDHGIGLTPEEMPKTILSLNKSNKISKQYVHGVFGKGGTVACQHSDATVIVSRKQPDLLAPDQEDRIAVAVITLGDAPDAKMDFFRYLAGDEDQKPVIFSAPADSSFEPGTYVAHINYQSGGRFGTQSWKQEESAYFQTETVLFRPVLPYGLRDARSGTYNKRPADRRQKPETLNGLQRRLDKAAKQKIRMKSRWSTITIDGLGDVRMRWWLFKGLDERRQYVAKGYATIFTSNGQVHHSWDPHRLVTLVPDKRRVGQQLLVEVDCDGLDIKKRVRLFSTDRVQLRKTGEGKSLEDQIARTLRDDPDLNDAEAELQSAALKSTDSKLSESLLRQLNQAIGIKTPGLGPAASKQPGESPKRPSGPKLPIDLYPEPTTIEGPEYVQIVVGGTASVRLMINAVDGFVPDRGVMTVETHVKELSLSARGDLRRGRLLLGLTAAPNASIDTYPIDLSCSWERGNGTRAVLTWTTKVEIVRQTRPAAESKSKLHDRGSVAFMWTKHDHQVDWTDRTAGQMQLIEGRTLAESDPSLYGRLRKSSEKVPTILLNEGFADWAVYTNRMRPRLSDIQWNTRVNRYIVLVGSAVANLHSHEARLRPQDEREEGPAQQAMTEEQQLRANATTARAIILSLTDMDKMAREGVN